MAAAAQSNTQLQVDQPGNRNLGLVAAIHVGPNPPASKFQIWSKQLAPESDPFAIEHRSWSSKLGSWELFGGNSGSSNSAEQISVLLEGITEQIGGRGPGDFDGSLLGLLQQMFIRFQAPRFSFFTVNGSASYIVAAGTNVAAGNKSFVWGVTNGQNVKENSVSIADVTHGQSLAQNLANDGNETLLTPQYLVGEGESQRYRITALDTNDETLIQDIVISGAVYRYFFSANQNLLDAAAFPPQQLSAYLNALPGSAKDLVFSRNSGPATYSPRGQYVYFAFDPRLLGPTGLGLGFTVNGQPNNDFLTRDFAYINEAGYQSNLRLLRTGNLLNADYSIASF